MALALATTLAGCVGPLPFQPEHQPFGATISADVRVVQGQLQVEIDSGGYRVEWAVLVDDVGATLTPLALIPPAPPESRGGLSIGLGLGAASSGSSGSFSVASGVGVPVGSSRASGNTLWSAWIQSTSCSTPLGWVVRNWTGAGARGARPARVSWSGFIRGRTQ
jgi:hypothetical protein